MDIYVVGIYLLFVVCGYEIRVVILAVRYVRCVLSLISSPGSYIRGLEHVLVLSTDHSSGSGLVQL